MNIFFLDSDIKKSAEYHVDKHVVKMRLELAQLACTTHHLSGTNPQIIPYKKTHQNHPSAIWARESLANYNYIVDLGLALCDELRYRFNTPNQKCEETLIWLKNNKPNIPDNGLTKPRLAINWDLLTINKTLQLENESDFDWAIKNYRAYYKHGKQHLYSWKNRIKPEWL
jgi:hypothetical protein